MYEQHCAFETTNLRSLDEAMSRADFKAYVEVGNMKERERSIDILNFLNSDMMYLKLIIIFNDNNIPNFIFTLSLRFFSGVSHNLNVTD